MKIQQQWIGGVEFQLSGATGCSIELGALIEDHACAAGALSVPKNAVPTGHYETAVHRRFGFRSGRPLLGRAGFDCPQFQLKHRRRVRCFCY